MQTNHLSLIKWIWQVNDRNIHVICLHQPQQHSWGLAGSSRCSLQLHPCTVTSCRSSLFWQQRDWQHEAGAVQSSTARCWPHTHGCLWFIYDLLILLMTYLCKSCSLLQLMIYLCFTYVLLIIDSWWHIFLWFTSHILLIYLCLINRLNYDLLLIYLWLTVNHINDICFTYDLLISHFD